MKNKLGLAQDKLEVILEVGAELGDEVEACHY